MRLTRLCVGIALWLALGTAGSAGATSTVILDIRSDGLYVVNSLGIALGAVSVLVEDATGFSFNAAVPGISVADSVYSVRPIPGSPWDALIINNTANGVTLVPAAGTVRLGAFLPGDNPYLLPGETSDPTDPTGQGTVLGGTIFDVNLRPIAPVSIGRTGGCDIAGCFDIGGLVITVPEPFAPLAALLPGALAVLAFTRRVTSSA